MGLLREHAHWLVGAPLTVGGAFVYRFTEALPVLGAHPTAADLGGLGALTLGLFIVMRGLQQRGLERGASEVSPAEPAASQRASQPDASGQSGGST